MYLITLYSSKTLFFILKIIVARVLGPKDYGFWSLLSLILLYGNFLDFGLTYALVKEVPFYRGKGQSREANEIKNTVFTSILILSTAVAVITLTLFPFLRNFEKNLAAIIYLVVLIFILQQIRDYLFSCFVADRKFTALSVLIISLMFVSGILIIVFILKFGLVGLLLGMALGYLLVLIPVFIKYKFVTKLQLDIKRALSLVKIGFPIMVIAIAYTLFFTIDQILIFKYLGRENLGYYGIVFALNSILLLFPASLGIMVFPRISERYGVNRKPEELKEFVFIPTIMLAYLMSALLATIYLFLPAAVYLIVPKYSLGINAARISLMGIMFFSVSIFSQKFLIAINQQINCLRIIFFALVFKIVLICLFINRQMGINGVAMATDIVFFAYSVFIIIFAARHYKNSYLESVKYLAKIYFPFVYSLMVLSAIVYFKHANILNIKDKLMPIFAIQIFLVVIPFGYIIMKILRAHLDIYRVKRA